MAVTINDNFIFGGEVRVAKRSEPFADGAVIRKVANGFMIVPYGESSYNDPRTHVFQDAADMATWIRKQYTPAKAK